MIGIRKYSWQITGVVLLILFYFTVTLTISLLEYKIAILVVLIIIASPLVAISFFKPVIGTYLIVTISFFIFLISRLLPLSFPTGTLIDLMAIIVFLGIFLKEIRNPDFKIVNYFNNPVGKMFAFLLVYTLFEVFNPYGASAEIAMITVRNIVASLVIYIVIAYSVNNFSRVKSFTAVWILLAFLSGLYAIYQEIFGFADFEWRYIHSVEGMYQRIYIWGHLRKFSFLSDVAAFGLLMAFTSIFSLVMLLSSNTSVKQKGFYFILTTVCLLAMTYSGTRTAYVMVPIGMFLFFLFNLRNAKVLVASALIGVVFLGILFGPFYSGPFRRLRSAFFPNDDPSMNVRDVNKKSIQPYMWSHPVGGGLMTTGLAGIRYARGHRLSGFPTDSGYLRVALEMGWIGLILTFLFYAMITIRGIKAYFNKGDPRMNGIISAYTCSFFALSVANLTQDAMGQKPMVVIVTGIFSIIPTLYKLKLEKDET